MTRSRIVWLVLALAGWIAVTGRCADVQIAEALAEAGVHERAAEVAAAQRDSLAKHNAFLTSLVDSAKVSEERAKAAVDSVTRDVALRSSRALRAAQATSDTLRASLTATQAAQLDRINAEWTSVYAAQADVVVALQQQVATLYEGIGARDAVIAGLGAELEAERAIRAELQLANGVYRGALKRQRLLGSAKDLVTMAAVGYVAYRVLVP